MSRGRWFQFDIAGFFLRTAAVSLFLMIQDFPDDEGFRMAPGLVVVASKGHQAIERDIAGLHIDNVEFRPLHQRADLVEAADQEIAGARRLRLFEQSIDLDVADRTGAWRTIEGGIPDLAARRQIATQRGLEFAQTPEMIGALIDHLTRGVDVLNFGDGQHRRLALRPAWPNRADAEGDGGKQAEAY